MLPAAYADIIPGTPSAASGRKGEGIEEVVIDAAVDDIGPFEALGGAA